ncbi:MAG TPA: hypothetical protein EYO33_15065 [Phycisphaerales bacterium]|nr:hypothetical protein [Phycisphaerales bacterium]
MKISNVFKQQWVNFKAHLVDVAEIQKAESAKRDTEMEALGSYQDSFRAARREQELKRGEELQNSSNAYYQALDQRNQAKRQGMINCVNKIAAHITDYLSSISSQPKPLSDLAPIETWDAIQGSTHGPLIAVIDTGLDYNHTDLKQNIWS